MHGARHRASTQTADKKLAGDIERRAEAEARVRDSSGGPRIEPPEQPTVSRALPAGLKAIGPASEAAIDPRTEPEGDAWARWSRDREFREAIERRKVELANQALATRAIYPLECVQQLAHDLRGVGPDWRAARATLGPAWGDLLKQQPELAPELTKRREQIITTLFDTVPPEYRRAIQDLRTLIDYLLTAHEAAAFLVGHECGRSVAGRDRARNQNNRSDILKTSERPRLTMGDEMKAARE